MGLSCSRPPWVLAPIRPGTGWGALALVGRLGAGLLLGCSAGDTGTVEINWSLVDRQGEPIFPGGGLTSSARGSSCGLPGRLGDETTADYDLQLELLICDPNCEGECADSNCQIRAPQRFSCERARATMLDIPASEEPLLFDLRAVLSYQGLSCVSPAPDCVAVPGPRERKVRPGRVTDLQVYQVVIDTDADGRPAGGGLSRELLDLDACGCDLP